jgi:SagB-type dehydrogenase family enzyme
VLPPDVQALRRYHERTKHSLASVRASRHWLDWSIKPLPFKIYRGLEPIRPPDDIGRLCRLSNGVLRWRDGPGGERYGFRGAPTTGALYHVELYLATAARDDLQAGLYHYGADDHALRRLRDGDVRDALVAATGGLDVVAAAPLVFVLTSTFWRNAWKYQARAYRHAFWDSGAVLANLLALAAADGEPVSVLMGFDDDAVDGLLGIDGVREASLTVVPVGEGAPPPPPVSPRPLDLPTMPLSSRDVRYAEIEDAHRASRLRADEVADWRSRAGTVAHGIAPRIAVGAIDDVIERRRSTRRFRPGPIARAHLDALLRDGAATVPGDSFSPDPVQQYLLVNDVEGLEPGAYVAEGSDLRIIHRGDPRQVGGALALGQELGADAAVDIFFLADLDAVLGRLGGRGYRVAQMAGGIQGARVELAATALGLGATGLTFFDDEVTRLFEPAAEGRQVMYLVAVGQSRGPHEPAG